MGIQVKQTERVRRLTDVVGIALGGSGICYVRVVRKKDVFEIVAIGETPGIDLPLTPSEAFNATLIVPKPYAAPYAAFAVEHPQCVMRLVNLKQRPEVDESAAISELFGTSPPQGYRIGFADEIAGGAPDGRPDGAYLACGIPEYLAEAVASLLPDSRRPAPASLQIAAEARLNAFAMGPVSKHADECLVHLQVEASATSLSVFNNGHLAAYRLFPIGNDSVVEEVARQFGLPQDLAVEMLCEDQIDTSSAITPVLTPLFRQVGLSVDFVARRENCRIARAFVSGRVSGISNWLGMMDRTLSVSSSTWSPLKDYAMKFQQDMELAEGHDKAGHHAALGAALALMEGE